MERDQAEFLQHCPSDDHHLYPVHVGVTGGQGATGRGKRSSQRSCRENWIIERTGLTEMKFKGQKKVTKNGQKFYSKIWPLHLETAQKENYMSALTGYKIILSYKLAITKEKEKCIHRMYLRCRKINTFSAVHIPAVLHMKYSVIHVQVA